MSEVSPQVYGGMWIRLSPTIKTKIAELFSIPRNGASHVNDNLVIADGYLDRDLAVLNVQSMNQFLGTSEVDIFKLWNMLISHVEVLITPAPAPVEAEKRTEINITIENGQPVIKTTEVMKPESKPEPKEYQPNVINVPQPQVIEPVIIKPESKKHGKNSKHNK